MKILIVDDCTSSLKFASIYCMQFNPDAEIATATHGEAGFEAYGRVRPDLLITDYNMPLLDGGQMVKKIKKHFGVIVPTLLMTSADRSEIEDPSLFDDIITKGNQTLFLQALRYVTDK